MLVLDINKTVNLVLSLQSQLDELAIEDNIWDYIGYPVTETEIRYFSVSNNSDKYYDNAHSIMGYKKVLLGKFFVYL